MSNEPVMDTFQARLLRSARAIALCVIAIVVPLSIACMFAVAMISMGGHLGVRNGALFYIGGIGLVLLLAGAMDAMWIWRARKHNWTGWRSEAASLLAFAASVALFRATPLVFLFPTVVEWGHWAYLWRHSISIKNLDVVSQPFSDDAHRRATACGVLLVEEREGSCRLSNLQFSLPSKRIPHSTADIGHVIYVRDWQSVVGRYVSASGRGERGRAFAAHRAVRCYCVLDGLLYPCGDKELVRPPDPVTPGPPTAMSLDEQTLAVIDELFVVPPSKRMQ